ncbi:MAG: ferritin-like domain-containing protein [Archangium sp.]|nr:ferritin-like domain-containing protein [Archangium sp.]
MLFELSMWGGAVERRYRKLRPEVERLPWGALDLSKAKPEAILAARTTWTEATFQEHRTGAACAATLQALIAARAPIDLVAMASRFTLDEMVHVEMCARLAQLLGGGAPIAYDPKGIIVLPSPELSATLAAAELVVRNFCVGEALSIPILRGSWHAARQPLIKAILARIVKDEAAHGAFGWIFLDWVDEQLTEADRLHLAKQAALTMDAVIERWAFFPTVANETAEDRLGWMDETTYLSVARRSLHKVVLEPLRAHGIDPLPWMKRSIDADSAH